MTTRFRDEAIPLITINDGRFVVNSDAVAILQAIEAPIAVVGVAGAYRSGKSYLLNQVIVGQTKGFGVGSTINACTKGIWMWGRPVKAQSADGRIVNQIILDSEGLGSLEADATHDARVFALTLFLCSMFIYNSTGAIDEASISSLSVVINITKHLTAKSAKTAQKSGNENTSLMDCVRPNASLNCTAQRSDDQEDDLSSYSAYFPDFYWVLRDFALQLVDEYGTELTANQYLEQALDCTDEMTESAQTKNKIREMIRSFFNSRFCFPLVRPVIEEADLSRLTDLKMEALRPEFVEGALQLKNSLNQNAKIKTFGGKPITGQLLSDMLQTYVEAVNEGAVPNIENTWCYVSKKQTLELVDKSFESFVAQGRQLMRTVVPCSEASLKQAIEAVKADAVQMLETNTYMTETELREYKERLLQKISVEEQLIYHQNEVKFERLLDSALSSAYQERIYTPVVNESVKDYKELIALFKGFKTSFESAEPDGPNKLTKLNKFLFQKACESFSILVKNTESKLKAMMEEAAREADSKYALLVDESKAQIQAKTEALNKLQTCQSELANAQLESSKLSESIKFLQEEKERMSENYTLARAEEQESFKKKLEQTNTKLEQAKLRQKELETVIAEQKSKFEIESSLLVQKIEMLTKIEAELNELRQKSLMKQRETEEAYESKTRKLIAEFEAKLAEKQNDLITEREQKSVLEDEMNGLKLMNDSIQMQISQKEVQLQNELERALESISERNARLQMMEAKQSEWMNEKERIETELKDSKEEAAKAQKIAKEKEDKLKALSIDNDSAIALIKQENEFLKTKVDELTVELADAKRQRELTSQALQKTSLNTKNDFSNQLGEVKAGFEQRLAKLQKEHELEREELTLNMNSQLEEAEQKIAALREEREELIKTKRELIGSSEIAIAKLKSAEDKLARFEQSRNTEIQELTKEYDHKIESLNAEKESLLERKSEELLQERQTFESNLENFRSVFESEKTILEKRIADERALRDNLVSELTAEITAQKESEIEALEEENENLRGEISIIDAKMKSGMAKLQAEANDWKGKFESLDRSSAESLVNAQKKHIDEINKMKLNLANSETANLLLEEKLNTAKNELNSKAMEVFKMQQTITSLNEAASKAQMSKDRIAVDYETELTELRQKLEKVESESAASAEAFMNSKIGFTKEIVLKTQKIEHLEARLAEITASNEQSQRDYDDRLKASKVKFEQDIDELKQRLSTEVSSLSSKYEEKKRQLREVESQSSSKLAELEKANCVLTERLASAETKRSKLEESLKLESQKQKSENQKLKEEAVAERQLITEKLERLTRERQDIDSKLAETQAKSDKDRAVLEAKISFLEQQNKKLKSDLMESQSSLETMFQSFQQYRTSDKEDSENSHTAYMISMEERYLSQIHDLKEQNKSLTNANKLKVQSLEREIKKLEQTNEESMTQRLNMATVHEKRLNELIYAEKTAQEEIERLKQTLNKASTESQREAEKKQELLAKRVSELESKIKALENDKSMLVLKGDRAKTSWNIEKDQLLSAKTDLLENIERLKRQVESANRENERLKTELKVSKKSALNGSIMNLGQTKAINLSSRRLETAFKDITNDQNANAKGTSEFDFDNL